MTLTELKDWLVKVFTHAKMGSVVADQEGDEYLNFTVDGYWFCISPCEVKVASIVKDKIVPSFVLSVCEFIPGRFNPYDGGTPPDMDEAEVGTFRTPAELARKIASIAIKQKINHIIESIGIDEMLETEKELGI